MQVGLSVNGTAPAGDTIGTAGDALITGGETQAQVTALLQLSEGDEVNPKILFTTNDGRVLANENFFGAASSRSGPVANVMAAIIEQVKAEVPGW